MRRGRFINLVMLLGTLCVSVLMGLWHLAVPSPDARIEVTADKLERLNELAAQPKYGVSEDGMFLAMQPEPDRLLAESQLNNLISRLTDRLEAEPSKRFVLREFSSTLAGFPSIDTVDRERACAYLEEIMDILEIESSDGLLNNWLYGGILGPLVPRLEKERRNH